MAFDIEPLGIDAEAWQIPAWQLAVGDRTRVKEVRGLSAIFDPKSDAGETLKTVTEVGRLGTLGVRVVFDEIASQMAYLGFTEKITIEPPQDHWRVERVGPQALMSRQLDSARRVVDRLQRGLAAAELGVIAGRLVGS